VQLPPGATVEQLLVSVKSPLDVIFVIDREAVPELVRVIALAVLAVPTFSPAKLRLAGAIVSTGAALPTPASKIVCGLFAALSVSVMVPLAFPSAVGVKVTVIAQLAPFERLAGQLLV
jgi:hypothetical protein